MPKKKENIKEEPDWLEVDVYKSLKTNKIFINSILLFSGFLVIIMIGYSFYINAYYADTVKFISKDGTLFEARFFSKHEVETSYARGHINNWIHTYYDFNHTDVDDRSRAKNLIIKEAYDKLESYYGNINYDWFNQVKKNNIVQEAELIPSSLQLNGDNGNYLFRAKALITIITGIRNEQYEMTFQGSLEKVKPFENNTHGFLITSYEELEKVNLTLKEDG